MAAVQYMELFTYCFVNAFATQSSPPLDLNGSLLWLTLLKAYYVLIPLMVLQLCNNV